MEHSANWSTYVANGILSKTAYIQVYLLNSADGGDPLPAHHHPLIPYVNGHQDATFTLNWSLVNPGIPGAQEPTDVCGAEIYILNAQVPISTEFLKFPPRAANGSTPTRALNQIAFATDIPNGFVSVEVGTLSFQAMAPIVLVHGWRGGPWNFESPTASPRVCTPDPKHPSNGGPDFVQALKDAKAPFDCSIVIDQQASIDDGAAVLGTKLPSILNSFGVQHVHLIAHSKGGLFAREFLQKNFESDPTTQIGVISLTTLETPHHGSVLSDTVVAFREDPSVLPVIARINPLYFFLTKTAFFGKGNDDMTVSKVNQVFNQTYLVPPPKFQLIATSDPTNVSFTTPVYYSTSSDADIDGNGKIGAAEALPDTNPIQIFAHNWTYQRLGTVRAINPTSVPGHWTPDTAPPGTFYKNDTAVTIESSQYLKFTELGPYVGASGRNHTTIRNPDIAQTVLLNIRNAESKQSGQ